MAEPADRLGELIEELRGVLEEERGALLSGTAEAIHDVARRKMLLADTIEQVSAASDVVRPGTAELVALARYNQENAIICNTMLRHLGDAIDRLRRQQPHRSYRPDGSEETRSARHPLGAA